jgi:hypothetical protein
MAPWQGKLYQEETDSLIRLKNRLNSLGSISPSSTLTLTILIEKQCFCHLQDPEKPQIASSTKGLSKERGPQKTSANFQTSIIC